jgi:predicted nucleotidyltransferase component of viral defense system
MAFAEILAGLNQIFAGVEAACGLHITFDREDRHGHQNSHTFYLRYRGPLPAESDVKVYAIEEIVIEKLVALSDRARNEPRDLYDLWFLFGATNLRIAEMRAELDTKLALRQRVVAGLEQAIAAKEDRLRRLWAGRLAHQMSQLPPFDDAFREVLRTVRAADLPKAQT